MSELRHHGVLGQKWGVRRYQNKDGTLKIPKGTKLYRVTSDSETLDSTRKYVTNNKKRSKDYERLYTGGNKVKLTLKTKKDLKLAGYKEISEYIKDNFNVDISKQESVDKFSRKNGYHILDFAGYNYDSFSNNKHVKNLIDMGYDAIIDMKDYRGNNVLDMPIILLKPDSDTIITSKKRI